MFYKASTSDTLERIHSGDPTKVKAGKPAVWFKSKKAQNRELHALVGNPAAASSREFPEVQYMAAAIQALERPRITIHGGRSVNTKQPWASSLTFCFARASRPRPGRCGAGGPDGGRGGGRDVCAVTAAGQQSRRRHVRTTRMRTHVHA